MTDKEIIKGLQAVNEHIGKHFNEGGAWMAEFIDNAIKALEQQPCEDAISRIEAIENFASWYGYDYDNQGYYRLLKQMPSVTPSYNSVKTELEPCEDAISREALVNELKCGYWNKELQSAKNDPCVIDAMIDWSIRTVKSQPSVTPQTRWIPVSEKMPEEDGYYVVSGGGEVWICEMLSLTNTVKGWCNSIRKPSVEAWMPLPTTPYKEDEE